MNKLNCFFFFVFMLFFSFENLAQNSFRDFTNVHNYKISLSITDFSRNIIYGETELLLSIPKTEHEVLLDLVALTVDSVFVENEIIKNFSHQNNILRINLLPEFYGFDTLKVKVSYHGTPTEDETWGGFYFTQNYAFNYGVGMSSTPPCFGRVWFPCIDNFTDRATYEYHLTVSANNEGVACGVLKQVVENNNNTKTYIWQHSDSIPTYLSAVAMGDFANIKMVYNAENKTIPIEIYAPPLQKRAAFYAFKKVPQMLKIYEDLFGEYPWEKVGFTAVPFYSGAMEHSTNIFVPSSGLDTSFTSELLYAHELSHAWFGNLVTCHSAADMWLNEGWASYCVALYIEKQYGIGARNVYMTEELQKVLRTTHVLDEGFWAVANIPQPLTYGSTVYDKGMMVVHSLRGYLGDSLFFSSVKKYLEKYKFSNATSEDLQLFLSTETGVDLSDFFNFWVYSEGFTHYSVDSLVVKPVNDVFKTTVFLQQKLRGAIKYAENNKVELIFFDSAGVSETRIASFSGQYSTQNFELPFAPDFVVVDFYNKLCDAVTAENKIITQRGSIYFNNCFFMANVKSVSDTTLFHVEHHWVAPDTLQVPNRRIIISNTRYWTIDGIFEEGFKAEGKFYYNFMNSLSNGYLDNDFYNLYVEELMLMYRKDCSQEWTEVASMKFGSMSGFMLANDLKAGQYTFAVKIPMSELDFTIDDLDEE